MYKTDVLDNNNGTIGRITVGDCHPVHWPGMFIRVHYLLGKLVSYCNVTCPVGKYTIILYIFLLMMYIYIVFC